MKKEVRKITITTKDGKPLPVPPEGSLGLLALGHIGLIAWRQARNAYLQHLKETGQLPASAMPQAPTEQTENNNA